jgi:mannosyl-oligosaccharide alpha-1,2-mannosidase
LLLTLIFEYELFQAQKVVDLLDRMHKSEPGLYPIYVRADQDTPSFASNVITLGAMGDSWYEYMLKMWVQSGGHSPNSEQYLRLYHESTKAVLNRLYRAADKSKQPAAGWAHLGDLNGGGYLPKMDHLVCFMSGVFALGVHRGAVTGDEAKRHMQAAIDIGETCANMYFFTASGVAPEFVNFGPQGSMHIGAGHNLLRPETVESMFILWRVTKDQKWRDFGWRIFQAFEKHCRTIRGYAGLEDVNQPHPRKKSRQESFWIAETLKYLYLLFSSDDLIPLDKYVFNTEAHPLPIFDGKSKQ